MLQVTDQGETHVYAFCAACGASVPSGALRCANCNAPFAGRFTCPRLRTVAKYVPDDDVTYWHVETDD